MKRLLGMAAGLCLCANSFAAANCDAIIGHGMRNIEVSQSANAAIALKYFNHCQKNFSLLTDQQLAEAEVEVFGYGSGSGGYSRQTRNERLDQWCTANQSVARTVQTSSQRTQTFYQGAVSAWESCNALNSKDIIITPRISPDAKTVDIGIVYRGGATSGVNLLAVRTEGFVCTTISPVDAKPVAFPYEVRSMSIQVNCIRDASKKKMYRGEEFDHLDKGTISIQTSSDPFQLYFAEEWDPGLPATLAEQIRGQGVKDELPIGTVVTSVLTPDKFFSSDNPQYQAGEWVVADGKPLPPGTAYGKLMGSSHAPDLRYLDAALHVMDVRSTSLKQGENTRAVLSLSDAPESSEWAWMLSSREVMGIPPGGDWEQDTNHFQTLIDQNGVVYNQSRTLNRKHRRWSGWTTGEANVFGIATKKNSLHHYVKVN